MNNKKQTVVDFLEEQILLISPIVYKLMKESNDFNEAKKMFEEQIIDAHIEGQRVFDNYKHTQWTTDQANNYYKETYDN
jgi:hypothetical protein